jgi:transposase
MSRRAAAEHYQVGIATAIRWTARAKPSVAVDPD